MTNPGNAVGTDGAYGGRTSVNAFNDVLAAFDGRGILQGWACKPKEGMTISFGGQALVRDVAIAENDLGQKTTINNRSNQPVDLTLEEAPALGSRIDVIVAYVNNPPDVAPPTADASIEIDNPSVCGLIAVVGNVSNTPVAPDETAIRTAITADGAAGSTAYYVVLATITIATGTTVITPSAIVAGRSANLGSAAIADGSVTTQKLANGAVTTDKIGQAAVMPSNIDWSIPGKHINAVAPGYFEKGGYAYLQNWGKIAILTIKDLWIASGDSYVPVLQKLPLPIFGGKTSLLAKDKLTVHSVSIELLSDGSFNRLGTSEGYPYSGNLVYFMQ